jgi:hypothetical protein
MPETTQRHLIATLTEPVSLRGEPGPACHCGGRTVYSERDGGKTYCENCSPAGYRVHRGEWGAESTELNIDVCRVCTLLGQALKIVKNIVWAHGEDYECRHCKEWGDSAANILYDVAGLRWSLEIGHDLLRGWVHSPREEIIAQLAERGIIIDLDSDRDEDDDELATDDADEPVFAVA